MEIGEIGDCAVVEWVEFDVGGDEEEEGCEGECCGVHFFGVGECGGGEMQFERFEVFVKNARVVDVLQFAILCLFA